MRHIVLILFFGVPVLALITLPLWLWLYHVGLALYKAFLTDEEPGRYHQQDPG